MQHWYFRAQGLGHYSTGTCTAACGRTHSRREIAPIKMGKVVLGAGKERKGEGRWPLYTALQAEGLASFTNFDQLQHFTYNGTGAAL
jgi:hypothetical protein